MKKGNLEINNIAVTTGIFFFLSLIFVLAFNGCSGSSNGSGTSGSYLACQIHDTVQFGCNGEIDIASESKTFVIRNPVQNLRLRLGGVGGTVFTQASGQLVVSSTNSTTYRLYVPGSGEVGVIFGMELNSFTNQTSGTISTGGAGYCGFAGSCALTAGSTNW